MGERTLYGVAREGWFIPYRYADGVDDRRGYPRLERRLDGMNSQFRDVLQIINGLRSDLLAIGINDVAPLPRWDQDWFAGLDAAAAYALVRDSRPQHIIEVGSGHSTRFMAQAITDGGFDCTFTAIDPQPRADISSLPVNMINDLVENVSADIFGKLSAGDILFIDSSHILMPGTDVDLLFGEIIPELPPGVMVHIHDVFLPAPYPPEWVLRGYNEQNALVPMIAGGVLTPVFPCNYVQNAMANDARHLTGFIPRPRPNHDASFWTIKA